MVVLLTLLVGFLCGLMNTVVSSGSVVTLPLLLFLGLAPAAANATNRLPVMVAAAVATVTFMRSGLIDSRLAMKILVPSTAGAFCGIQLAMRMRPHDLELLMLLAILIALVLLLGRARQALLQTVESVPQVGLPQAITLFFVGLWLGLIVLDGAAFLLLALILSVGMPMAMANAYKNLVLAITSVLAVMMFAEQGVVDWRIGGQLAIGGLVGGIAGAKIALAPAATRWIYRLLVIIIMIELLHVAWKYAVPQ